MTTDKDAETRALLAEDRPYVIRHGDVWTRDGRHICDGSGRMAVSFDEDGVLLKHGAHAGVATHARTADGKMRQALGDDAPTIHVVDFPVMPETIEELNACIAATGRVLRLSDRLQAIGEQQAIARTAPIADAPTATPAEARGAVKVWVARRDLQAALGMPVTAQANGPSTAGIIQALEAVMPAVRQPVFRDRVDGLPGQGKLEQSGEVKSGRDGLEELERGFGSGARRGLHVDPAHAGTLPAGAAALDLLQAYTALPDRKAAFDHHRTKARDGASR